MAKKMMMNASSSKNKRKEECGKWLTKKSKSTIQQVHFKPGFIRTLKPIIFEDKTITKSSKMKQSTMSQFLVEDMSSGRKENEINSNDSCRTTDPVLVSLKKGLTSEVIKYEDHEGSNENDLCQTKDRIQENNLEEKEHALKDMSTEYCRDALIKNSFQNNCKNVENKSAEKLFPLLRRFRQSNDSMDQKARLGSNSAKNEIEFTEWFENEVEVFVKHYNEEEKAENILSFRPSSICAPPDSKEDAPQFSEWYNHHVQTTKHKELPINIQQSPTRDVVQHNSTFTQWLESNIRNIKSP